MPTVVLIGLAMAIFVGTLFVGRLLRPNRPTESKESPYECGEIPTGQAWSNFNVRFYVVSLIFIIFDVEGALMFPVAVVFRRFNEIGMGGGDSRFFPSFCRDSCLSVLFIAGARGISIGLKVRIETSFLQGTRSIKKALLRCCSE